MLGDREAAVFARAASTAAETVSKSGDWSGTPSTVTVGVAEMPRALASRRASALDLGEPRACLVEHQARLEGLHVKTGRLAHRQQALEAVAADVLTEQVREQVVVERPEAILLRGEARRHGRPVRFVPQEGQLAEGEAGLARVHVPGHELGLDLEG